MIRSLWAFSWKASWTLCRFCFHPDQLWFSADFSGSRRKAAKKPHVLSWMGEHSDPTSNYILIKKKYNPCRTGVLWDFPGSQGWLLLPSTGGRIWRQSFTAHLYQPLLLLCFFNSYLVSPFQQLPAAILDSKYWLPDHQVPGSTEQSRDQAFKYN